MQYVTSIERLAKQEGFREGFQEGLQEAQKRLVSVLTTQLSQRFGQVPGWVAQKLEAATTETLLAWGGKILQVRSLEEVFA